MQAQAIPPADETLEVGFWASVAKTDTCWNWMGARANGYGMFFRCDGKRISAHRVAYQWLVGPIPEGLVLDHLCRNPRCVNPEHLEPVTQRENLRRGRSPGGGGRRALQTHCRRGHEMTPENTYQVPGGKKHRQCRKCRALHRRRYHERQAR